jgi:hypothetical protein
MKCCNCPALRTEGYEYPETYCGLGISDEDTIEFKDGELGCKRISIDKILKDLKIQDEIESEAFAFEAERFVDFMEKERDINAK